MNAHRSVVVFGAYGHTGRFVVSELCRLGWVPILSGRDAPRLEAMGVAFPALERRVASIEDPAALDRALDGAMGVINCAGPFLDTAVPVVEAALRARIHYLDICAEQRAALDVFERFAEAAATAGVAVMPAMAFYGGLADLLATAAMHDWAEAESIDVAVALDSWHPTPGTRLTGARNRHRRLVVAGGRLQPMADPPASRQWTFAAPFGTQAVVALPMSEIVAISRHLRCGNVQSYMNLAPLDDLRDPRTPAPVASDAQGRSPQVFAVEVTVRRRDRMRRATAHGRDIYAITAPLVVEALQRIRGGQGRRVGTLAAGEAFDARDFLASLPALNFALPDA